MKGPKPVPIRQRFYDRWEPNHTTGCCEWIAGTNKSGYGQIGYKGTMMLAHRLSWMLHKGDIPTGLFVLHECDNRRCIRPSHLFLGTHQDNMDDMLSKGRLNNLVCQDHGSSKLSNFDVLDIRYRYANGQTQKSLCLEFNVCRETISYIVCNKTWTNILNRTPYDGPDTMPDILFLVYDPTTDKVIYYANGILELFRLRKVYNPPDDAQVYRYVASNVYTDRYFAWDKDTMWWKPSHHLTGVGFGITSFASLEAGYKMLGGK